MIHAEIIFVVNVITTFIKFFLTLNANETIEMPTAVVNFNATRTFDGFFTADAFW